MTERPAPPPEVSQVDPEGPPGRTFRTWVGRLLAIAVDALYRTVRVHSEGRAAVDSLRARGEGYA